jgi:hypothetical protein
MPFNRLLKRGESKNENGQLLVLRNCGFFISHHSSVWRVNLAQGQPAAAAREKLDAKPADKNSGKVQPKVEEPEANTSADAEVLQKPTQNPVAS